MNTNIQENPDNIKVLNSIIETIEKNSIRITEDISDYYIIIYAMANIDKDNAINNFHRIHRFSENYKYEETEKTLQKLINNLPDKLPSFSELQKVVRKHGISIKGENINYNPSKQTKNHVIMARDYIKENYDIRFNTLALEFDFKEKGTDKWTELNENDVFLDLQQHNIKVQMNNVLTILRSSVTPKYDPINLYFKSLPEWDGNDYIEELCNYLDVQDKQTFVIQLKKWLVRVVRCAIDNSYFNKQVFVLIGPQNNGKSTLCRFFCPKYLEKYIAENIGIDKDSRIAVSTNYILVFDELAGYSKKDLNSLKALISAIKIKERIPYDRKASSLPRRGSFMANSNHTDFLNDETGSVRFLCFIVNKIDFGYSQNIDINLIYSQAYALLKTNDFNYEMTYDEIQENEIRNKQFRSFTVEMDLISRFLEPDLKYDPKNFIQTTQIMEGIKSQLTSEIKVNNIQFGKGLRMMGFAQKSYKGVKGYYVKWK